MAAWRWLRERVWEMLTAQLFAKPWLEGCGLDNSLPALRDESYSRLTGEGPQAETR